MGRHLLITTSDGTPITTSTGQYITTSGMDNTLGDNAGGDPRTDATDRRKKHRLYGRPYNRVPRPRM